MKLFKKFSLLLATFVALSMALPATTSAAWSPFGGVNCSGAASKSVVCQDRRRIGNPLTGPNGLIMLIANVIAVVGGIASVVIIVLAGLRFVTAGGSSDDVAGARRTLIYAVVGLIIIVLSRTIVAFTLGKV